MNIVDISPLAAEQLQWTGHLDRIDPMVIAPSIGAIVLSSARFGSLAAWAALFREVRARVAQGTFSADVVQRLEELAR